MSKRGWGLYKRGTCAEILQTPEGHPHFRLLSLSLTAMEEPGHSLDQTATEMEEGDSSEWDGSDSEGGPDMEKSWEPVKPSAINLMAGRLFLMLSVFVTPKNESEDQKIIPMVHWRKYDGRGKEQVLIPTKSGIAFTSRQLRKLYDIKDSTTDAVINRIKKTFRTGPGDTAVRVSTVKQAGVVTLKFTKNAKTMMVTESHWNNFLRAENIIMKRLDVLEDGIADMSPTEYEQLEMHYGTRVLKDDMIKLDVKLKTAGKLNPCKKTGKSKDRNPPKEDGSGVESTPAKPIQKPANKRTIGQSGSVMIWGGV